MGGVQVVGNEYGYVALVVVAYCLLNLWMSLKVGEARKKYSVFNPTMYATEAENKDAKLFNCVQRGHQNSVEMMPMFFVLIILGGISHPVISASLGAAYSVARYFYFKGYSTGHPKNRLTIGRYGFLALLGLGFCAVSSGLRMLTAASPLLAPPHSLLS